MTAEDLQGQVARSAAVERELRLRVRDLEGGDPAEWPADLRVREFQNNEGRT